MAYYWFKAFHLIGVVVWFAGLFYLVRLFVYHAEAATQTEPAQAILKAQYEIMDSWPEPTGTYVGLRSSN